MPTKYGRWHPQRHKAGDNGPVATPSESTQLKIIGIGLTSVIVAALLADRKTHPAPAPAPTQDCAQLCECNGAVVACQIPGSTCPPGMVPALCNGPQQGSVVPCLTAAPAA